MCCALDINKNGHSGTPYYVSHYFNIIMAHKMETLVLDEAPGLLAVRQFALVVCVSPFFPGLSSNFGASLDDFAARLTLLVPAEDVLGQLLSVTSYRNDAFHLSSSLSQPPLRDHSSPNQSPPWACRKLVMLNFSRTIQVMFSFFLQSVGHFRLSVARFFSWSALPSSSLVPPWKARYVVVLELRVSGKLRLENLEPRKCVG